VNILQLLPKLNVGGVEKGTVEVARYLTLNGHKAVVISGGGILEKNLTAIGARHYTLPIGRKNIFIMVYCYFKLKRIIRKENIDIVHARSRVPALIGYFAARKTGRKFLTTAHGQYKSRLISRVMGWGRRVIVANETMARYMKDRFKVPLRKMMIIPRGVDLKKFSFISPAERKGKNIRIGMICRFTPLKGHMDFLKAASYVSRRVCNLEIILMGDKSSAKEEYLNKIQLSIRRLMLENVVTIKDSNSDVADVMKNLDIFVSANKEQEAFGRSIIEAQARGVPVVATRVGGVVENIEDGVTGLLCKGSDPSDMAEKLMDYINNPALMEKISDNARKYVEEKYSLDKMMKITLDAYSEVIQSKNILIFKISSLGDVVLSVPSIRALRRRFPRSVIKVMVDIHFREIFDNCPYIDEIITCDLKGRDRGLRFLSLAAKLRAEDFDISVDLQNSRKSHLLSFLASIQERYWYDNGKFSFFLNRKISLPEKAMNPVDHQAYVLGLLGVTNLESYLELWPSAESDEWADGFIQNSWLKKDQKIVGISISASRRWESKNWPISEMAELSDILAKEIGARVIILGLDEDVEKAEEFCRKTSAKPIDAVGKTNISQLISLIKRCDILLTGDSASTHIAGATETPFVALFGPTDPERHLHPVKKYKVLRTDIKCSPCYKPVCNRGLKCIRSIKPREVFNELKDLL